MRRIATRWIPVLLVLLFFGSGALAPRPETHTFNVAAFARLPVNYEGRVKPVDTLARNLLSILSGRQSCKTSSGQKYTASEWFLNVISGRPGAQDCPIIRIDHSDIRSLLQLEPRKGFRYAYSEVAPAWEALVAAAQSARYRTPQNRDSYDRQLIKLADALSSYRTVLSTFQVSAPSPAPSTVHLPRIIPPDQTSTTWRTLAQAQREPLGATFSTLLEAYRAADAPAFNRVLSDYERALTQQTTVPLRKIRLEVIANRLNLFIKSAILYLVIFLLSGLGLLSHKSIFSHLARQFLLLAFMAHTLGIAARMLLSGYPPITNLYSSAIFVGWGGAAAGLLLEWRTQRWAGLGGLVGSVIGFTTLLIAHFLAGDGDTMEQMSALLNSRFWLTLHVVTIALGYIAEFVTGLLGIIYLLGSIFSRRVDRQAAAEIHRMLYATLCFALFFTFTGTVLGGLWGDNAWGRFWGWDPKENGALLIILWNAIMLHARHEKRVGLRGFAVMAIFGNAVTAWSWFGVNLLGIGLHAYGFMESGLVWLTAFIISQLILCGFGMVFPRRFFLPK